MHFLIIKMKGLEMVKCESLRINMFRITHTGKSVNFPVTILKQNNLTAGPVSLVESLRNDGGDAVNKVG